MNSENKPTSSERLILLCILLIGGALRVVALSKHSLWLDEVTSLQVSAKSLHDILTGVGFDSHTPPFYYLLLHFWLKVFDNSAVGLRSFSVLFDIINIALVYWAFSRLLCRKTALTAATLYALSGYTLYYAQEGRMYSFVCFLSLSTFLLALHFMENKQRPLSYLLLLVIGICGMYTHYYYALSLFAITLGLSLSCRDKRSVLIRWWAPMLLIGIAFLPWLGIVMEIAGGGGQAHRKFLFLVIPYTFFRFVAGYAVMPLNYGTKSSIATTAYQDLPEVLTYTLVFAAVFLYSLKRLLSYQREIIWMLLTPLIVPGLLALLISLKAPMLSERYLIISFPFFAALLALGLVGPRSAVAKRGIQSSVYALLIYGIFQYFANPSFGKVQWKDAASYIVHSSEEQHSVYVLPHYTNGVLDYYLSGSHTVVGGRKDIIEVLLQQKPKTAPGEDSSERSFWIVERGTEETLSSRFEEAGFLIKHKKLFVIGNGLRVYFVIRQNFPD